MPLNVAKQRTFEGMCDIQAAVEELALSSDEDRGAIFTRPEVVEFILDLAGYKAENDLTQIRLLEPSFGHGEFLLAAIDRLMISWRRNKPARISQILPAIRAVELHRDSFDETKSAVRERLKSHKLNTKQIDQLVNSWLIQDDYLLWNASHCFDVVVGNPPYLRLERMPDVLMREYRTRYQTMFDRADLYIPFIERSLDLVSNNGKVAFICADRWMKNRYGGPLRKKIADDFGVGIYVDMVDTPAFHSEVIAYPAITVLSKEKPSKTRVAIRPEIERGTLSKLSKALTSTKLNGNARLVREVSGFMSGDAPWLLSDSDSLMLARRLEETYPTLEEAGCKVGIGVATGADKVFIRDFESLDVEPSRKLRLATTRDIMSGEFDWRGLGVINPFKDEGGLVDLKRFPKLAKYLNANAEPLKKRHVAKKSPANWYRTIDRITPSLANREKLLIPDIKGHANIVFESGELYPHHNLYFITSDEWDLQALKAVLTSGIAHLFVSLYSTKMRGDYLRFQAQHLRRIRVPHWNNVPATIKRQLKKAGQSGSKKDRFDLTAKLFGLSDAERSILERKEVNK